MEPFLEFGGNGVLLAVVLAAFKALENRAAKKNGGSISVRIESIEKNLEVLTSEFRSFRQEVADRQLKADIIREISHEQQTGS